MTTNPFRFGNATAGWGSTQPTRRPEIQLLGSAVLLQDLAVLDALRLIRQGVVYSRRSGITPPPRITRLVAALDTAAKLITSQPRHDDDAATAKQSDLLMGNEIGSRDAAQLLGLSVRQVQRIAVSLEGRRTPGRAWVFDETAVRAYQTERSTAA